MFSIESFSKVYVWLVTMSGLFFFYVDLWLEFWGPKTFLWSSCPLGEFLRSPYKCQNIKNQLEVQRDWAWAQILRPISYLWKFSFGYIFWCPKTILRCPFFKLSSEFTAVAELKKSLNRGPIIDLEVDYDI